MRQRFVFIVSILSLSIGSAPNAVSQWVQTNGPYGGNVFSITKSGNNLFAATENGVFRSTDSGTNWAVASTGLPTTQGTQYYPVGCIGVIGTMLFAGTNFPGGVYRSTNNGATWAPAGLTDTAIGGIEVIGLTLFAVTSQNGVYRSTDNGISWATANNGVSLDDPWIGNLSVIGARLLGSNSDGEIFLSTDTGSSWKKVYTSPPAFGAGDFVMKGSDLFAVTSQGMLLSADSGVSWTMTADSGLEQVGVSCLGVSGTNLFAGSQSGVFLSTNNGVNWNPAANNNLTNTSVQTLATVGTRLLVGTNGGGVYSSDNSAKDWSYSSNGLSHLYVRGMAASGPHLFTLTDWGVFQSNDNGASCIPANGSLGSASFFAVSDSNIFAATDSGIFIASNNAADWRKAADSGLTTQLIYHLATSGTNIFALTDSGIFLSTNNGTSWNHGGLKDTSVTGFTSIGTNLFAAIAIPYYDSIPMQWPLYHYYICRSTDSGMSWEVVDSVSHVPSEATLTVIGTNLFAGSRYNGVFLSTDQGVTWTAVNSGLTDTNIYALTVSGSNLFAGTHSGVFLSKNSGTNWEAVNAGLTDTFISSLAASTTDLFAGADTGVWSRPLSDFGISSVTQTTAPTSSGIQIFPNPFSQSTQITFISQAAGYAEVSIVNMLGVEVARLFSGELGAGNHSFMWSNPTGLPDGMYECLVRMNGQVKTLPVVLMR